MIRDILRRWRAKRAFDALALFEVEFIDQFTELESHVIRDALFVVGRKMQHNKVDKEHELN